MKTKVETELTISYRPYIVSNYYGQAVVMQSFIKRPLTDNEIEKLLKFGYKEADTNGANLVVIYIESEVLSGKKAEKK